MSDFTKLAFHYYETAKHKARVMYNLGKVCGALAKRAWKHDASKFREPEASTFAEVTPKLEETTYGSEEYNRLLDELGDALEYHYAHNTHHPEYYDGTVQSMEILDVVEMLCDWEAATHRHADGDIEESLIQNQQYGYGEYLTGKFRGVLEEADLL